MTRRIIGLCLCALLFCSLLTVSVGAVGWSDAALAFAADCLPPDCAPAQPATRAEFAYMVTHLFGLQAEAPIAAFPDVTDAHPYAQELRQAVALGLLQGSDGYLLPDEPITREQAFVILSRAFALPEGSPSALNRFSDGDLVSSWAVPAAAGLTERGLILGSDGALRPGDNVSIEELAQLLRNLSGRILDGSGTTAIAPVGCTVPAGTDIDGDLYLCCNDTMTLTNVTVSGQLVIRGSGEITLKDTRVGSVILCDDGVVLHTVGSENIEAHADAVIHGGAEKLTTSADLTLRRGTYGSLYCENGSVTLEDGAVVEEALLANASLFGSGSARQVTITGKDCDVRVSVEELIEQLPPEPLPASAIETIRVQATVKVGTGLFSDYYLTHYIGWVNEGTTATYTNYVKDFSSQLVLPDGTTGWVSCTTIDISTDNYVRDSDYTTADKENYVNQSGYISETPYLVWVSLKCQRVNVFLGSTGNWKLIQSFTCATGKNSTPTIAGVFSYKLRQPRWDFGSYYVRPVLIFNGGHAFHSRTYTPSGGLLDDRLGIPVSAGCVRMQDEDVNWLDLYLPLRSTVVVY